MLTAGRLLYAAAVVALVVWAAPAVAGGDDCHYELVCDADGNCEQRLVCEGSGGGSPGDPGDSGGDPGALVCAFRGDLVPCSVERAGVTWWYSPASGCYFHREDPWPNGVFEEKKPDGAVYMYYCLPGSAGGWEYTWLAADPPGYGGAGVNPRDLADQAVANMHLQPITIGIVPEPGPGSIGIVGMPTWLWVDDPTGTTFGPISESVSAAGVTVTATASVSKVEWSMGDGSGPVICQGPGTPYADRFGTRGSPTCGHRYEQTSWDEPGHVFNVTADSYWVVTWTGGGQSGTFALNPLEQQVAIRVGEAQVLTR